MQLHGDGIFQIFLPLYFPENQASSVNGEHKGKRSGRWTRLSIQKCDF